MPGWLVSLCEGRLNRVQYVAVAVVALYLIPLLLGALFLALGLPVYMGFGSGGKSMVSLMSFWYLQIPLFAWGTLLRVQDIGWPRWAAALLWFPIVNFVLWFWPGQGGANHWGQQPPAANRWLKVLAYAAPLWILLAYAVVLLVLVKTR